LFKQVKWEAVSALEKAGAAACEEQVWEVAVEEDGSRLEKAEEREASAKLIDKKNVGGEVTEFMAGERDGENQV